MNSSSQNRALRVLRVILRSTWNCIAIGTALVLTVLLAACAYGGNIDPNESALPSAMVLAFPYVLAVCVTVMIFFLLFKKWISLSIMGLGLLSCLKPILVICPLNALPKSADDSSDKLKIISFNAYMFEYNNFKYVKKENEIMNFIYENDPDVVLLQEGTTDFEFSKMESIKGEGYKKLKQIYPYFTKKKSDLTILSKYPYTESGINRFSKGKYALYKKYTVNANGREIDIVNVHLESVGLHADDKALYEDYVSANMNNKIDKGKLSNIKQTLLNKLASAFKSRAEQARVLREYLDNECGPNTILCGDFNDVPLSYAYRTIRGDDMSDAYADCAFGPTITYHENRFYFRIDHILYRGNLRAIDIERGNEKMSDHYPLICTFEWDK